MLPCNDLELMWTCLFSSMFHIIDINERALFSSYRDEEYEPNGEFSPVKYEV